MNRSTESPYAHTRKFLNEIRNDKSEYQAWPGFEHEGRERIFLAEGDDSAGLRAGQTVRNLIRASEALSEAQPYGGPGQIISLEGPRKNSDHFFLFLFEKF